MPPEQDQQRRDDDRLGDVADGVGRGDKFLYRVVRSRPGEQQEHEHRQDIGDVVAVAEERRGAVSALRIWDLGFQRFQI